MDGSLANGVVRVDGDARQRFYDSRGYGRPLEGNALALAPVEAAHLLYRADLESVDGMGFREFLAARELGVRFLVYKDLRERGFYLSPARAGWVDTEHVDRDVDFVVYPRGNGPWDGLVEYRVRCVGERDSVAATNLGTVVLAVVDEDGDLSYFRTDSETVVGESSYEPTASVRGRLLADRVLLEDPPDALYERGFYGRPLEGAAALACSLVEAAYLADRGILALEDRPRRSDRTLTDDRADADDPGFGRTPAAAGEGDDGAETGAGSEPRDEDGSYATLVERGRAVEGERFDRRLTVYATLRDRAVVPKTGFKFGADFRTYDRVESVEDLGHSERLVRVVPSDYVFSPRDLALDVRLAGGVRKRMVFAQVDADVDIGTGTGIGTRTDVDGDERRIEWLAVSRLTP